MDVLESMTDWREVGAPVNFLRVLDETQAGLDGWFPEIPVPEEGSQTVVKLPRGRPDVSDVQS